MSEPELNTDLIDDVVPALLWLNSSEEKSGSRCHGVHSTACTRAA